MGTRIGIDGDLYYQTDGVSGSAGWTLCPNVMDLELDLDTEEADDTTREAGGWKSTETTLRDATVDFGMRADQDNAHYVAFRDAWLNKTHIGIRVYDGDDTDGNGIEADFKVKSFKHSQTMSGVQTVAVTLRHKFVDTVPVWNETA